ncbi:K02A2.6-like [Cordylochernes scorpioides]|uniref:K02A2.6-like n=1 Tax=Cordylochernes scorpioides TaxID=51811 RepID=A0ABY6L1Y1_9ARAC|nr:K02A2.6-like [Cordylochernes scorpioides]
MSQTLQPLCSLLRKTTKFKIKENLLNGPVLSGSLEIMTDASSHDLGNVLLQKKLEGYFFTLWIDHKPLITLFDPSRAIPTTTAARMKPWILTLLECKLETRICMSAIEHFSKYSRNIPIEDLRIHTRKDTILSKVLQMTRYGWPRKIYENELKPFA